MDKILARYFRRYNRIRCFDLVDYKVLDSDFRLITGRWRFLFAPKFSDIFSGMTSFIFFHPPFSFLCSSRSLQRCSFFSFPRRHCWGLCSFLRREKQGVLEYVSHVFQTMISGAREIAKPTRFVQASTACRHDHSKTIPYSSQVWCNSELRRFFFLTVGQTRSNSNLTQI